MKIGIPRELGPVERRVAIVPETVRKLAPRRFEFVVQPGAGEASFFPDSDYASAGARIAARAGEVFDSVETVAKVNEPTPDEIAALPECSTLVSLLSPLLNIPLLRLLNARKITSIALDMIPRTTLAQSMDVLSSQASIAGYWAVVAAASRLPKYFPMLMTAAGTLLPARVLVMGAGVAGLQAIGTARRLGASVEATDVRPETKEQVESLGAKFLQVEGVETVKGRGGYAQEQTDAYRRKQAELIAAAIGRADVVITTALVPGRKAPILVTEEHLRAMKPGSVVVDLAAPQGGNVAGCEPGRDVMKSGVLIMGPLNAPSQLAQHASLTFSRNIEKLLLHITADGAWKLDMDDEIVRGCVITRDGQTCNARVLEAAEKSGGAT